MNLVLDTNAFSNFISKGDWKEKICGAERIHLPLIVLGELRFGFRKGTKRTENETALASFLKQSEISVLCPDEMTSFHYANLRYQLSRQGTPIPQNDIWIAALAIQHNLWLCTSDAHFDHIPQLLRASS